jgi:hypothetical protein
VPVVYGRLEKEEIEINRKIDRGIRTIFGTMVAFILLVFLNEIITKTGPVKGVVLNAEFLEEGWVGPPSMFSNGPNFMSSFILDQIPMKFWLVWIPANL